MNYPTDPSSVLDGMSFTNAKILTLGRAPSYWFHHTTAKPTTCEQSCAGCKTTHPWTFTPVKYRPSSAPSVPHLGSLVTVIDPTGRPTSLLVGPADHTESMRRVVTRSRDNLVDGVPVCLVRSTLEDIQFFLREHGCDEHPVYLSREIQFEGDDGNKWLFRPMDLITTKTKECGTCNPAHEYGLASLTGGLVPAEDRDSNPDEGELHFFTPPNLRRSFAEGSPFMALVFVPDTTSGSTSDPLSVAPFFEREEVRKSGWCDMVKIEKAIEKNHLSSLWGPDSVIVSAPSVPVPV